MEKGNKGILYLVPNRISETGVSNQLPAAVIEVAQSLRYFICEHVKNLRGFLKAIGVPSPYDHLEIVELNKHTTETDIPSFLEPALQGHNIGLVSDAGCPGIADPGAEVVKLAHDCDIRVVPLVGPSSLLLTLMGSGFNGQQFMFHGYLPQQEHQLKTKLRELEMDAERTGTSHLFIEAPYRNEKFFALLLKYLQDGTRICIGTDVTGPNEFISTKPIFKWRTTSLNFNKMPAVFIIGR